MGGSLVGRDLRATVCTDGTRWHQARAGHLDPPNSLRNVGCPIVLLLLMDCLQGLMLLREKLLGPLLTGKVRDRVQGLLLRLYLESPLPGVISCFVSCI
mmetsp:Transcript_5704/g.15986  ORF Transcript_5704/g.15986 Transcript_5704/m.15986 type:complete len:99 (+) Transcript_5704:1144-1440(+)